MGPDEPWVRVARIGAVFQLRDKARELLKILIELRFVERRSRFRRVRLPEKESAVAVVPFDRRMDRDLARVRNDVRAVALLFERPKERTGRGRLVVFPQFVDDFAGRFAAPERAKERRQIERRAVKGIEEDRFGGERVERGGLDPRIAVRAEEIGVETVDRQTEDIAGRLGGELGGARARGNEFHFDLPGLGERVRRARGKTRPTN